MIVSVSGRGHDIRIGEQSLGREDLTNCLPLLDEPFSSRENGYYYICFGVDILMYKWYDESLCAVAEPGIETMGRTHKFLRKKQAQKIYLTK